MTSKRWPILGASMCALALALVAGQAAPGASTPPRWIVFSAHPNGKTGGPLQLMRIQTTGAGLQQITRGSKSATEPAFSPDGKRIAFARLGAGIFRMNLDGTGLRRLTSGVRDIYPVWSPDGKRIAFLRPFRAEWRLYVTSPTGAGLRRLAQAPPAGRPPGRRMASPSSSPPPRTSSRWTPRPGRSRSTSA